MLIPCCVEPSGFVCHLHEAVPGDGPVLAHLPECRLLVVVDRPDTFQECRNDVLVFLLRLEVDAPAEGEVGDVPGERACVVDGDVGLAGLTFVGPVVPEVPGPVIRIPRQARAVDVGNSNSSSASSTRPSGLTEIVRSLAAARMLGEAKAIDMASPPFRQKRPGQITGRYGTAEADQGRATM